MPVPFVLVLFASGVVLAYAQHNVLVAPHDAHMGFHERPFVHDDVIMDDHHHGYPMDGYHRDYPDMHDDYHHVEHIDAAPVERIEETHVHAPDITHHQEIIHHEPVDVIHEPVLVEHDDEVLHDNVHGHDLFDEFPMHHHHPHHLGVMGAFFGHDDDDDRHVDSEHGDDEVVDNDHSEFADDLNQFTNREKGRNKRKQGGTDKSNVQTSATLTATVTATDDHSDDYLQSVAASTVSDGRNTIEQMNEVAGAQDRSAAHTAGVAGAHPEHTVVAHR